MAQGRGASLPPRLGVGFVRVGCWLCPEADKGLGRKDGGGAIAERCWQRLAWIGSARILGLRLWDGTQGAKTLEQGVLGPRPFVGEAGADPERRQPTVLTANTSGWSALQTVLRTCADDGLLAQEHKRLPCEIAAASVCARNRGWKSVCGACAGSGGKDSAGGAAIFVRERFGLVENIGLPKPSPWAVGAFADIEGLGRIYLVSFYFKSGEKLGEVSSGVLAEVGVAVSVSKSECWSAAISTLRHRCSRSADGRAASAPTSSPRTLGRAPAAKAAVAALAVSSISLLPRTPLRVWSRALGL